MAKKRFRLVARVSSADLGAVKPVLQSAVGVPAKESGGELVVEGRMEGESAKGLNRSLLSAMRRVEKRTRLRAEWTSDDGTTQRFFDYVLKKETRAAPS